MRPRRGTRRDVLREEIGEGLDDLAWLAWGDWGIDDDDDDECPSCGFLGYGMNLAAFGDCLMRQGHRAYGWTFSKKAKLERTARLHWGLEARSLSRVGIEREWGNHGPFGTNLGRAGAGVRGDHEPSSGRAAVWRHWKELAEKYEEEGSSLFLGLLGLPRAPSVVMLEPRLGLIGEDGKVAMEAAILRSRGPSPCLVIIDEAGSPDWEAAGALLRARGGPLRGLSPRVAADMANGTDFVDGLVLGMSEKGGTGHG